MRPSVHFQWIKDKSYKDVWDIQTLLHRQLISEKLEKRNSHPPIQALENSPLHQLIFCEHAPVFTLGKSGSMEHLLLSDKELESGHIEFFKINRGGDITYHGPGQITGYPILDLEDFYTDVHRYVRNLEEVIIRLLKEYGLQGIRIPEYTGVWLGPDTRSDSFRKICAIGVHLSRWVSMHGFAFNVNTELSYFDKIVPCGIVDENKKVTSLAAELGTMLSMEDVGLSLKRIFSDVFECSFTDEMPTYL
ncbi:MAG: lipoyl(octanoyl) transferase LipB [Saprospiraceae bacterium]|nr:lipoyl(octanoyl) transferase LipB [Saprospiraceae bacterium]MBK8670798.1 lipoyl(octanoyl) transferase LipB [Saprospiraceae bacterium]